MRMRLGFLYGDSKFDVPKCKYSKTAVENIHCLSVYVL